MLELIHPYSLKAFIANNTGTESRPIYGDIYESLPDLLQDHPNCEEYMIGFGLIDVRTGMLAKGTADWYDTPLEAFDAVQNLLEKNLD